MTQEVQTNDLKEMISKLIPYSIGKDTEYVNLFICFVRKIKMLKKLSLNQENSWSFMVKLAVLAKLLAMRRGLKVDKLIDMSP